MVEENVFDPLAVQTKKTITRQRIAKSPSLLKIQEKTRLRRGRAKPIPLLTPDPDPITLPIDPIPITKWSIGKKYAGRDLEDIPTDYYLWAIANIDELNETNSRYNRDLTNSVEKILTERDII